MADPALSAVLKRPFAQQLAFLRQRLANQVGTRAWDDLWKSQHDHAFMVAGAMKADLLADLAAAVERSIAEGTGIGEFRKEFRKIVERTGWAHTGSHNWRTRIIYRTNAATSYAAGRLQQLRDGGFGYWMYKHGGSADPRPQHLAWDGMVLPADHPFWNTHSPPNGWGCSCRIVGLRRPNDARRLGGDPDKPLPDGWDAIDPKTGEPAGIDKGWGYQPGATANLAAQVAAKAATLPPPIAQQVAQVAAPSPAVKKLSTIDDFVDHGRNSLQALPDPLADPAVFVRSMLQRLDAQVGTQTAAVIANVGAGAKAVQAASKMFPDKWTKAADTFGRLYVRSGTGRGYQYTVKGGEGLLRLPGFGAVPDPTAGMGFIQVRPQDIGCAIHEYAHRLQAALPDLDALFQQLHRRRTAGDRLRHLGRGYGRNEVGREDHYFDAYQGKEYSSGGALEVLTMAFQALLSVDPAAPDPRHLQNFRAMYTQDPEMFRFAVGLLFGWEP